MADEQDKSSQTEAPTQRRLDQAQEHGDVVKSTELSSFILLGGATLAIAIFGKSIAESMTALFRNFLEQPDQMEVSSGAMVALSSAVLWHLAAILGPFFGLVMASGLIGNVIQHRPVFTADKIKPDFSKLSIPAGLKRMFGIDGLTNLGKGLLKIGIVGLAIWTQVWPERTKLESVLDQSAAAVAGDMSHLLFKVLFAALGALAVIAAADYFLQRYQFMQRNKMSKQEIKEEFRQSEGDPHVKAKIKQLRIERSRRRMIAAVPGATVVITNPTHYAVALKYESGKMQAPVCVAKGVDALALRIREIARKHDVPIIENPPLARALHATVEVDQPITAEHYQAVAQVIGYVMRLSGKIPG